MRLQTVYININITKFDQIILVDAQLIQYFSIGNIFHHLKLEIELTVQGLNDEKYN